MDQHPPKKRGFPVSKDYAWPAMIVITLMAMALRSFHLGFHTLWYDETFTAWAVAQTPKDIVRLSLQDVVHPPLYYFSLSFWTRLVGDSEFALRTLSAGVSLLGVPLLYQMGRRGWDRSAGLAAALLWACSPFAIWHAQEARMYALLTIVGLAAALCLARALPRGASPDRSRETPSEPLPARVERSGEGALPWLVANAVLNLIGLYTHYFYFFLILSQYIYLTLTLRRHRRVFWRWFVVNGVAVLLYLPWLVAILRGGLQRAQIAWIAPLSLQSVWQTFWELSTGKGQPLSAPAVLIVVVLTGGLVAAALVGRGRRNSPIPGLCWLTLLVPLVLVALISIRRPLFYSRFLQIVLPVTLLLAAAGITRLPRPWMSASLLGLVVLASVPALSSMYVMSARHEHDFRKAMHYLSASAQPGDAVAFQGGQGWHGYWYYYEGPPLKRIRLSPTDDFQDLAAGAAGAQQAWLVVWDTDRSCEPPDQLTPGPQDRLRIAHTECSPEIAIVAYAWQEQQE